MLYKVGLYIMYEDQIPGDGTTWRESGGGKKSADARENIVSRRIYRNSYKLYYQM